MSFEQRVTEAIQPIRFHVLAIGIYHLINEGIYDKLLESPQSLESLTLELNLDKAKSEGFFKYLANEDILTFSKEKIELTPKGLQINEARGHYIYMVGGYNPTYRQIGEKLRKGSGWATRDSRQVGVGTCQISYYDAIPMTKKLIAHMEQKSNFVLDIGCGSALYLVELCKLSPELKAWGMEKDYGGYQAAIQLVEKEGLSDRIKVSNTSALDSLQSPFEEEPNLAIVNYVLQEVLMQDGEEAVVEFLTGIVKRFPNIYIVVIEIDMQIENKDIMSHDFALASYNPYYLVHYFTEQKLQTKEYWENMFERCNLEIVAQDTTDVEVDSTGLEIGYLLRAIKK